MKTTTKLLLAISLLAGACTTGSRVTSTTEADDLYFTPGDAIVIAPRPAREEKKPQQKSTVAMQVEEFEQGKIVNNYIVPKSSRKDQNAYYFDEKPAYADTVFEYKDEKEQVTINNYFEGDEMDYSTRLRTFYNPYLYDPFWDPFWSPYYGYSWGGYYSGFGWGHGWYDPWYAGFGYGFGYGGYYPGFGYGYGYGGYGGYGSYWGYGGGFYPGWGWGGDYYAGGGGWSDSNRYYGKQNHTGKRGGSNATRNGGSNNNNGALFGSSGFGRQIQGRNSNTLSTRNLSGGSKSVVTDSRLGNGGTVGIGATSTRMSGTREIRQSTAIQQNQEMSGNQGSRTGRGEAAVNLRRNMTNNIQGTGAVNPTGSSSRAVSTGGQYTPTYNRPRMNTQPSYNNSTSRQYNTPQTINGATQSSRYSRPQSSGSGTSGSTRVQSSSSYQRGAAGSSPTRSYSTESNSSRSYSPRSSESNSSSRSYSAPAPSFNNSNSGVSGGGSYGGSSGGGSQISTGSSSGSGTRGGR